MLGINNAVGYIYKYEQVMRADSMAEKLLCNNSLTSGKRWELKRSYVLLPGTIEVVSGNYNIAELWRQPYFALFNCVKSDPYKVSDMVNRDVLGIITNEVHQAIKQLSANKASGSDKTTAEPL